MDIHIALKPWSLQKVLRTHSENTHRLSRQTWETTLSTLSGETDNTTLSSNTLGSRSTGGALHRKIRQSVSGHVNEMWYFLFSFVKHLHINSEHLQGLHQHQ